MTATPVRRTDSIIDWELELQWLTALDLRHETRQVRTVARDGQWYLTPDVLRPTQTPVRLQRGTAVVWNVVGRRQPRAETDLHRDRLDRPRIAATQARLVRHAGRYSVIGQVTNADADPAAVSIFADIRGAAGPMSRQAAGTVNGQRLLPAETAGFRVDFDGVLSLQDALSIEGFDPTQFVPPEFEAPPHLCHA